MLIPALVGTGNSVRGWATRAYGIWTVPPQYGGQGKGHLIRYVRTEEELLACGPPWAPTGWPTGQVAHSAIGLRQDRKSEQLLRASTAGRLYFALGMVSTAAGSDWRRSAREQHAPRRLAASRERRVWTSEHTCPFDEYTR